MASQVRGGAASALEARSPNLLNLRFTIFATMRTILLFTSILMCSALFFSYCKGDIEGCMDIAAENFDPHATKNDGSCYYTADEVVGCTNPHADNYNPDANTDNGTCIFSGCTDPTADNYDSFANLNDGSCIYSGCTDELALNYNSFATIDDGSCDYDFRPLYEGAWTATDCIAMGTSLITVLSADTTTSDVLDFTPFFVAENRSAIVNGYNIEFQSQPFGLLPGGTFSGTGVLTTSPDTIITIDFIYDDDLLNSGTCTVVYTKQL